MRRLACLCLIASLLTGRAQGAAPDVYALTDPGDPPATLEILARDPRIDGLVIRTSWDRLQPTAERYEWASLDAAFAVARRYHKKITLHILTTPFGPMLTWIYAAGAAHYTVDLPPMMQRAGRATQTAPVPWDTVYLEAYHRFLLALRDHLQSGGLTDTLGYMSDATPIAEMSLIGCRDGRIDTVPYNRSQYLAAWRYTIAAHSLAFPAVPLLVSAPVRTICLPDQDGQAFYRDLIASVSTQDRKAPLMIFAADLTAQGSDRVANVAPELSAMPHGFQMMWQSTHDPHNRMLGSLSAALCSGLRLKGQYFEIYKDDILNQGDTAMQNAITALHDGQCRAE